MQPEQVACQPFRGLLAAGGEPVERQVSAKPTWVESLGGAKPPPVMPSSCR
jgi:hypothetical protein